MIEKIGVDIIKVERIRRSLEDRESFLPYMFNLSEIKGVKTHSQEDYYFASLFAIKEAAFKSLNIVWQEDMDWKDFCITSVPYRHPTLSLTGATKKIADSLHVHHHSVSNSYDDEYVIATVLTSFNE